MGEGGRADCESGGKREGLRAGMSGQLREEMMAVKNSGDVGVGGNL